jgi:hypothetical protein
MTTVLLAGDSWGIGVFKNDPVSGYGPVGLGIQSLLQDLGINVVNISKAGGANWLMIDRLNGHWNNFYRCSFGVDPADRVDVNMNDIECIVFLQTDVFREKYTYVKETTEAQGTTKKWLDESFISHLLKYDSLTDFINQYFNGMYIALNDVGQKYNKPILCIGGWSKLHQDIVNYPNLIPLIPSAAKLLVPSIQEDVFLSDPEWFIQLSDHPLIMKKFGNEIKMMTVQTGEKFNAVCSAWGDVHPDIDGYKKIVDQILPYLVK